jgi:hypothetical protein
MKHDALEQSPNCKAWLPSDRAIQRNDAVHVIGYIDALWMLWASTSAVTIGEWYERCVEPE